MNAILYKLKFKNMKLITPVNLFQVRSDPNKVCVFPELLTPNVKKKTFYYFKMI